MAQMFSYFFKGKAVAASPESYLDFSRQCLEEARMVTSPRASKSSKVMINYEQCKYLANSLEKAVYEATLYSEHNLHLGWDFYSNGDVKKRALEPLKILCTLAKNVKCFIQSCCNGHWLHTAVMLTNFSHFTASLGFDLHLFTVLLPLLSASKSTLSSSEVSALWHEEGKDVEGMASKDEDQLVTELLAFIQDGHASDDDLELAAISLERFDRLKLSMPSIAPEPSQAIFYERDLTSLKDMVQIGRGGHGSVHKASWLGIDVAVKIFYGSDNPEFNKEVPILAGLSHPNIVSFLCHGKDMGECSIVMELMDGDLFSLLKERMRSDRTRSSPFSVFEEFDIMLQIAEAMDYLHKMRVLHRDLKCHNILVRCMRSPNAEGHEYVQVKVSDFGLSRTKEFSMTQSNMTPNTGTARWMAPELIKFRNADDIRDIEETEVEELVENYPFKCDVYSFGMVCLEILTGNVPFPNMTANEVQRAVCAGKRPELPDRCNESLKTLIEECWNPEASSRPCFDDVCTELRYLKSLHMTQKPQWTRITMFTIRYLRRVTGNFAKSNFVGRGDCSIVHRGILVDGREVAVKRMVGAMTRPGPQFIELQVGVWMSARHPHLVETLGYCIDGNDLLLVTEYMSQGTLAQRLTEHEETNSDEPLLWQRRLMILMNVAQALKYLHGVDSFFLHFNLKSSNVLLDDDLNAKVSGFVLVNCCADDTLPQSAGLSGYTSSKFTGGRGQIEAAHVYSFGVVLMEMLTGRPAVNNEQSFVSWFRELDFFEMLEGNIAIIELILLAMICTADNPEDRPGMDDVVSDLREQFRTKGLVSLVDLMA